MRNNKKNISFNEALIKLQKYCAYQERCTFEVKQKLNDFLLKNDEKEKILTQLKQDDFLDDERFAAAFVHGKFHFKKWGKIRLKNELRQKKIAEELIQNSLKLIAEEDYEKAISNLVQRKFDTLKKDDTKSDSIKIKLIRYLNSKGYEYDLIYKTIEALLN